MKLICRLNEIYVMIGESLHNRPLRPVSEELSDACARGSKTWTWVGLGHGSKVTFNTVGRILRYIYPI